MNGEKIKVTRDFSSKDVKQILDFHKKKYEKLIRISKSKTDFIQRIDDAANLFVANEALNILRGIPVEELNRKKKGIRVRALYDHGIRTMADVYCSTIYNLSSIYGISQNTAHTIKQICNSCVEHTFKEVKIKLSIDQKNKYSNELVRSIDAYLLSKDLYDKASQIAAEQEILVQEYAKDLRPALRGFVWFFSSKIKKEKAVVAYEKLLSMQNADVIKNADDCIRQYKKVLNIDAEKAWKDFAANNIQFYNILEETNPGLLGTDDILYGLPEELAQEIQSECIFPDGLLCTLRRYQEWGVKYILHQEKVLLGDEMGLGKTIQAIATMVSLRNIGATHFLVVCPASVLLNWCREITRHSLLSVTKMHGTGRLVAFDSWKKIGGVGVTTYETLSAFSAEDLKISLLVVDEAHYIKNPRARRTFSVKTFAKCSERLLFMTGTALENNVGEMINLIKILQPSIARTVSPIAFMSSAPQFRLKVAPVYYRRKREDVLTELPEKTETKEWCELQPEEERIYENAILARRFSDARRVSWNIKDLAKSSKAQRLMEIVEEAESDGRKVLVFSFFLDTIFSIVQFLGNRCMNPISGSVSPQRRQEILDEFDNAPAGSVLVSQIQSGGTGLNIQSASVVVICEPQFKPSIENQAISRSYRMGQARNVLVYRLLCANTVDERLTNLLERKQEVFDAFADKSVAAEKQREIDDSTFEDIIIEEIERIKKKRGIDNDSPGDNSTYETIENDVDPSQYPSVNTMVYERASVSENEAANAFETEYKNVRQKRNSDDIIQETNKKFDYYKLLMKKSYADIVDFLLLHHGPVPGDYFVNETCKTKNKNITRTSEGLFCHHIDEDKAIMLSNDVFASKNPFTYQKAERLVYCNYLEHLLLHTKIAEEPKAEQANLCEEQGIGGTILIANEINDIFMGVFFLDEWRNRVAEAINNDYDSYVMYAAYLWRVIQQNPIYKEHFNIQNIAFSPTKKEVFQKLIEDIQNLNAHL